MFGSLNENIREANKIIVFGISWVALYKLSCQMTAVSAFAFVFVMSWHRIVLL